MEVRGARVCDPWPPSPRTLLQEALTAAQAAAFSAAALMELAVRTLVARKGLEPVVLEVKGICAFADYFIICSGNSRRQILALARYLEEALDQAGVQPLGVEGLQEGNWVLLDYNDVIIHLFLTPLREFYDLEGLWAEAPRVPLDAVLPPPARQAALPVPGADSDQPV